MAMTSSPSSVSSCAMIEPVQPSPIMTTSFLGSLRAMAASMLRRPFRAAGHADGRERKALVVAIDPVEIIVAGAGVADHRPRRHVAVAAVDRVGEEAHLDVLDGLLHERLAVGAFELEVAALKALQHGVLVLVGQVGERLVAVLRFHRAVERREPLAVLLRGA